MPNVSNLFKKQIMMQKHYILSLNILLTQFTCDILDVKIKEKRLVNKSAVAGFIDTSDLKRK